MAHFLSKTLLALSLSLFAGSLIAAPAPAPEVKKTTKAKPKAKAKKAADAGAVAEAEPDVANHTTTDYNCELGNKVTVYHNAGDADTIAVRWKKKLHRLTRVGTTTGANRFENKNFGLIWIGIPAKGMLLDSRQGRQLANECKSPEQETAAQSAAAEPVSKQM